MSKPWGGAGAWAADSERAEAEEREHRAANPVVESSYPSLKDSVAAKPKKKNKGKTFTLSEFATGNSIGPGAASRRDFSIESKGLTHDEMYRLPTGPRERSAEEMEIGRLGGGFKNYGGGRSQGGPPMGRRGDDGGDGSWGGGGGGRRSYGGFDDDRRSERPPPRVSDFDMPSRADEVDNWAMGKKPLPRMDSGRDNRYGSVDSGRQDKYSSLGGGSRADEVDNWGTNKKSLPVRSTSNFGSGFRDPLAPEADRWTRTGPLPPREFPPREVDTRERPRLVLDPPRGDGSMNEAAKSTRPSPFGAARPREDVLAEKGLDWKKLDSDIETKKTSRPTSPHSSRPSSAHSTGHPENPAPQVLEGVPKPRPKVNPFGDAKPREVLLQEKGMDWRKIDFELEHRSVDRPETVEEQVLKDEIDYLKKELEKEALVNANGESVQGSSGVQSSLRMEILNKEKELELLICDLDDKVRFGQKATERPGSGAGRSIGFTERPGSGGGRSIGFSERPGSGGGRSIGFSERPGSGGGRNIGNTERPPSQSGRSEEYRNVEYIDRPQSRGTGDAWTRPVDDRRAFQGTRDRGFLSSREDRPRSRERW